ncbi:hypothetical protein [Pseudonocardia endophytica]|uniref:HEPN domain-containing protein n=1 Tax=Pseudonocardia endophytica TaxID=401976 RepID=A0A4R1HK56_PSEEN|nr:hypothetical protein [Pseudonocardia endophytica]TCK22774.1 hypothetical protein EV378_6783 [Pseudonocardia endophytica]
MTSAEALLNQAGDVLDGTVHVPTAQRTRSAGHLGRQALELVVAQACLAHDADLPGAPMRTRLIVLDTLAPADVSRAARSAWEGLSRSYHRHAYELPPTDIEIRVLLATVRTLLDSHGNRSDG